MGSGPSSVPSAQVPRELGPRVIYVRDEAGKLVPWINVPWERLQQMLNQQDGMAGQQPPQFQLEAVRLTGRVVDTVVELEMDLHLVVWQATADAPEDWLAIPLRFHEAALLAPAEHEGDGELQLVFDEQHGYQAWLRSPSPGDHHVRLRLGIPLRRVADANQIRFFPPLANRSQLRLELPTHEVTATIENGDHLTLEKLASGGTLVSADGLRNQTTVTWREGRTPSAQDPTYLDVRGDVRVSIDGPGALRSNVTLDLQSWGRPIEQFALRLPPSTMIVSGNQPGYTVSETTELRGADRAARATYQVKLEKPATQTRIQLTTQTSDPGDGSAALQVANYEVEGAISQSGRVSLLSSAEWLVYWTLDPAVRRVPNVEQFEVPQERQLLATFEYFRQPCALAVEISPQKSRVAVEPLYRMRVQKDRVLLETQLHYRIRGARVSFLNFAPNGWTLDDIGPAGAVENDDYRSEGSAPIKVRLTKPTAGDVTLTLTMHRLLDAPQGTLRFPLPWPAADTIAPGNLFVEAADALQLTYRLPEMAGFVQDPLLLAGSAPRERTTPPASQAAFRMLSDRALGDIVMDYQIRSQEIRLRVDTAVEVAGETAQVAQRFDYRVLYEPAARVRFEMPAELYDLLTNPRFREAVQFQLDGVPLDREFLLDVPISATERRNGVSLNVPLDRARLGSFVLEVRYPWPLRSARPNEPVLVPLGQARDGELMANSLTVTSSGAWRAEPIADALWQRDPSVLTTGAQTMSGLTARTQPREVRLQLSQLAERAAPNDPLSTTIIERSWLQTWLSAEERLDRAVYRITTGADGIRFRLPAGVRELVAVVDGQTVVTSAGKQELRVPLPTGAGTEHTVELSLRYGSRPAVGSIACQVPQLEDAIGPRRWYWHLLLPQDEHLLASDRRLTSANGWHREGLVWARRELQTQANLEAWTQAIPQPPLPTGVNQYLFSSLDLIPELEIRTCGRATLVYGASGGLLVFGLLLLYLPRLRHPALLATLAAVVGGAGWLHLDAAVLLGQAGLLGALLVVLAAVTARILPGWTRRPIELRWQSRGSADSRSGVGQPWREAASPPPTTIAAPNAAVAPLLSDSKVRSG